MAKQVDDLLAQMFVREARDWHFCERLQAIGVELTGLEEPCIFNLALDFLGAPDTDDDRDRFYNLCRTFCDGDATLKKAYALLAKLKSEIAAVKTEGELFK